MEENILRDFESFEEFPDKYLRVNKQSNLFYVKHNDNIYVANRSIDYMTNVDNGILYMCSYYNVLNGSFIINLESINNIECYDGSDLKIIPLNKILNITDNSVYYLSKEDIDVLVNYDQNKVYSKK